MAKVVGYGLQIVGFFTGNPGLIMAGKAILVADAYDQQRKQRNRARDAYNASLQDRMEMVDITADAPRTLVLGRVRAVEGVRRRWVSGTNSEKLTMIVSFAGHEIDAFEGWYFNDVEVAVDGDGWVTTAPFYKSTLTSRQYQFSPSGSAQTITLDAVPVAGSITATWAAGESVDGGSAIVGTVSGTTAELTGLVPGTPVWVSYQSADGTSTARIRSWLGAPGQNVGAALAAEYPGKIGSTDAFAGMAVAAVDILYDPDVYPQGRPNITARMRGAKVYDPRKDSTAGGSGSHRIDDPATWEWSETSALCALRYATWSGGFALPPAEINTADVASAATVGEVSTTFTLRKSPSVTTTVTLPRYRCGIVISSAADPRSSMADIIETMAGRSGWAGGVWRLRAGTRATPSFSLDPTWLARRLNADGQPDGASVLRMSNGVLRDQKINRISGSCIDPDQRWQVLPFPAVQDAVLIAAEGEYASEVQYQGVNHIAHAQHLASVAIRENQASLRIEATCNLYAYRCELFDVGTLLLPRYGMTPELAKTAEVEGWRWHPTEGIVLQMAEISAAMYTPVAELVGRDPAPNSDLPLPGEVEQLSIGTITSGTVPLTDGSVLTRTQVNWGAAVSESIRAGGQIEVQYLEASATLPATDWPSWIEGGGSSSATIPGLRAGLWYVFRIRALKPMLGIRGPWSAQKSHLVAQPPASPVKFLRLKATALTFAYPAGGGSAVPSSITLTAELAGSLTGTPAFTVSYGTATLAGSGLTRTLAPMDMATDLVTITASLSGYTDTLSIVKVRDGTSGTDGNFTDYVFKRAASAPATPTGDGTPAGWSGAPPAEDGNPLWMSKATKTAANVLVGVWSSPVRLDGVDGQPGDSTQVEYSVTGSSSWHSIFATGDIYMRQRVGVAGSWSAAIRIVGENGMPGFDGSYTDYVFKRAASAPATPTGSGTPAGWSGTPPAADGNPLWMSKATKDYAGTVVGAWSSPIRLDGADGAPGDSIEVEYSVDGTSAWHPDFDIDFDFFMRQRVGTGAWSGAIRIVGEAGTPGADGNFIDYIFKRAASTPATPTGDGTPVGWAGAPPAADGNPLWMSKATKTPAGAVVVGWSTPVRLDGSNGAAGDSTQVEYSVDGSVGWHGTFTSGDLYMRQRVGSGSWSAAIRIVGENGGTGATGNFFDHIFVRSAATPATPTGGGMPAGWHAAPPAADGNPLWMSTGEKTASDVLVGSWAAPVRLDGETSYLHIKWSDDGGTSFTASSGETPGTFIGTYTDFTAADSSSPGAYTWARVQPPTYRQEGDPGAVQQGSTWTVPSTGKSYIRQGSAWIPNVGAGSVVTDDLAASSATEILIVYDATGYFESNAS